MGLNGFVLNTFDVMKSAAIIASFLFFGCSSKQQPESAPMAEKSAIQYEFAYEAFIKGDLIPALAAALKAQELSPKNADVKNLLALIYFRQQKYEKAEKTFKEALELDPKASDIHNNLGTLYYETKRYPEAIQTLEKALVNPLYLYPERIYNNLGLVHEKLGQPQQAKAAFDRAIQLRTDFHLPYQNLGRIYVQKGEPSKGRPLLEEAAKLCAECSEPRYYLGMALLKENKRDQALKVFKEGASVDPKGHYGQLCQRFLVKE